MKLFLAISGICAVLAMLVGGSTQEAIIFANTHNNSILITKTGSGNGTILTELERKAFEQDSNRTIALSIQEGSMITLTAQPTSDSEFAGWNGACRGRSRSCIIIAGSNPQITAKFISR